MKKSVSKKKVHFFFFFFFFGGGGGLNLRNFVQIIDLDVKLGFKSLSYVGVFLCSSNKHAIDKAIICKYLAKR